MIPMQIIAESLLIILMAVSIYAAIFLGYAAFLFYRQVKKNARPLEMTWRLATGGLFIAFIVTAPIAAYWTAAYAPNLATAALIGGITISGALYFLLVRKHWPDDRVQYTVLMLSLFAILICMLLGFTQWLYANGSGIKEAWIDPSTVPQHINTFAQITGILVAATMIVITNRHNARQADDTTRQQIYQTLEIESVRLFRFETKHPALVAQQSRSRKSAQADEWNFCLTAGTLWPANQERQ